MKVEHIVKVWVWMLISCASISCSKNLKSEDTVATNPMPWHNLQQPSALDSLVDEMGKARIVMLCEASHGTSEFYTWRAALTKRLVEEKGFNVIAVEGEWADSYRVNEFIQGTAKDSSAAVNMLKQYDRWPTWMWGNYETASLVTWLNQNNQGRSTDNKTGFYGLDVYCIWESAQALMPYLQGNDSLMAMAQQVKQCFQPYSSDAGEYMYAVANASANCSRQAERLYNGIMKMTSNKVSTNETHFVMQQHALVILNGERYYRSAASNSDESWNIRDRHMTATVNRLLQHKGANSKIIIWAHNTHVGDARYTDMVQSGNINLGQLLREQYAMSQVYAVGFGTHSGTVIASSSWGGSIQAMKVPAAQRGSWEDLLHRNGAMQQVLFSSELGQQSQLTSSIGHRAIGVTYNPFSESGNYVPTIIPKRYDAFVFIDKTTALKPIPNTVKNEPPDTYPSGY